jgi:hypothetical protein
MMTRHRANAPRFVDETVDGEALIMDMVTGTYYSCLGPSTVAWNLLKSGATVDEVATVLSSSYAIDMSDAERDLKTFVDELLSEEMLVVDDRANPSANGHVDAASNDPGAYEPLRLERYTDLADLILLDPVHDVTDSGWPHEPNE